MYGSHLSGTSSSGKIAFTGHSGSHAPQSMHSSGSMYNWSAASKPGSSLRGWIQSTGQTSTQAASLTLMHGSVITYVILHFPPNGLVACAPGVSCQPLRHYTRAPMHTQPSPRGHIRPPQGPVLFSKFPTFGGTGGQLCRGTHAS